MHARVLTQLALLCSALSGSVAAQDSRQVKYVVPGSTPATHLGQVALSDELLAVGAEGARSFAGVVVLFDRVTGQPAGRFMRPGAEAFDRFGGALAADGAALVVGAPGADLAGLVDAGHAARYDPASGAELVRYEASTPLAGTRFGSAVAVDGEVVAVGAPGTFPFPPDEGQVHLFDRLSGAPRGRLGSPDPSGVFGPGHFFGASLAAADGLLVIGAPGTASEGTAFVHDLTTGALLHRLEPPAAFAPVSFGTAVAVAGGRVAVGDPEADGSRGVVHVYEAGTGAYLHTVENTGGTSGSSFGGALALDTERLVIADRHATVGPGQGRVTLHDPATGALQDVLAGFPVSVTGRFGSSLALRDGALAVGDVEDSQVATYAGAAYLVTFP